MCACDIMGPTNETYYIDEISWEISLLVPLINTKSIVIMQFFSIPLHSSFSFFLAFLLSHARFHFLEYINIRTHTQMSPVGTCNTKVNCRQLFKESRMCMK